MLKNLSVLTGLLAVLALSACNSDSSKDKKNVSVNGAAGDYLGSYEAESGCTTGRQIFTGASEEEIGTAFCNGLKDEKLNNNCARPLRADIFKSVQCPGDFPNGSSGGGNYMSFTESYGIAEDGCGTGLHYFAASNETIIGRMYCKGLKDDTLNRNCAKGQRDQKYQEYGCDKILN